MAEAAMAAGDWRGFLNTLSPASRAKCGGLVISEAFTTCLFLTEV